MVRRVVILQLLVDSAAALGINRYQPQDSDDSQIGVANRLGVTRYQHMTFKEVKNSNGSYWGDSMARESQYNGASDLAESVVWGWHHPNGVYNTIPVGAPLIDGEMKIYLATDDAVRKFDLDGGISWTYAPRGQLASAPCLLESGGQPRIAADISAEEEEELRPDSAKGEVKLFNIGDRVKVRPGMGYHVNGKEYYKAGDQGEITNIMSKEGGKKAVIHWNRTGFVFVTQVDSMDKRFALAKDSQEFDADAPVAPKLLIGTTTNGYVFAIDMGTGEEVWATQASEQISGVKGAVGAKDGVVLAATNRCVDRYCYRYRNQTNPLSPSNSVVRALNAADGTSLWEFRPDSPVWNFQPQFIRDDKVLFSDFEGTVYCLNFMTGDVIWKAAGTLGTYIQASMAAYQHPTNKNRDLVIQLGENPYTHKYCNHNQVPGVLPHCGPWPGTRGYVRALDANDGHLKWEQEIPEPPASAAVAKMRARGAGGAIELHTKVVVTMGFKCHYNSPTKVMVADPYTGDERWLKDGPTLWSDQCAGDKEGSDVRRAMGSRSVCEPNSWSVPVTDSNGDLFIGNQVGVLQRWSSSNGGSRTWEVASTLTTGVAFQDQAIAIVPGLMAISTCTSLIVLKTDDLSTEFANKTWTFTP